MLRSFFLIVVLFPLFAFGPCGPIPGGALSGTENAGPIASWNFLDEVPRCAVEVRPDSPHSVTVNCMSWQGRGFVSCSSCDGKTWSRHALANPIARLQAGENLYPVALQRIEDEATLDRVWSARLQKIGEEPSPRAEGWWTFELRSR